jgi:hypothetical protein
MVDTEKIGADIEVQSPRIAALTRQKIERRSMRAPAVPGGERLVDEAAFEHRPDFCQHRMMHHAVTHRRCSNQAGFGIVDMVQPPG